MPTAPPARSTVDTPPPRHSLTSDFLRVENYPRLSHTAVRVIAHVNNSDASVAELAEIIRREDFLTATVLRIANNMATCADMATKDVRQAIGWIGLADCGRMLAVTCLKQMFRTDHPAAGPVLERLHKHALFVAHLASLITRTMRMGDGRIEFTAGLLHDIGRLLICVKSPESFLLADPVDFHEDEQTLRYEREVLRIDHCAVGYQFAQKSELPEGVTRVILNHHRPNQENYQPILVSLIALADDLANRVQRDHKLRNYDPVRAPGYDVITGDWDDRLETQFREAIPQIVVQAIQDTRKMAKATA